MCLNFPKAEFRKIHTHYDLNLKNLPFNNAK